MTDLGSEIVSVAAEKSQALTTAHLEQIYERAIQRSGIIYEEEKARVLRVQLLLLEDENFTMQDQLAEAEDQVDKLQDNYEDTREQLMEAEGRISNMQSELKGKLREAENYKAELQALHSVSADSTKLLTEKLALSRELASLKPEIEHLRSQAASNQSALSEKLALQREVSSLQVELETEKRAIQRVRNKDTKPTGDESKAQTQLEELKKELAKEKKESQKVERDMRKQMAEWEGQKTILESKLDAFRNKLRSTKEQLKEAEEQLEKAQSSAKVVQTTVRTEAIGPANPRKRPVARFDPDMTIGTPGESHAAKRARLSTVPGEKSTFSITPFLNKTTSILVDSPHSPKGAANDQDSPVLAKRSVNVSEKTEKSKMTAGKRNVPTETKDDGKPRPLQETTAPRANTKIGQARKETGKLSLPRVNEEEDEENEPVGESTRVSLPKQPLKKQKMLGGRNKSTLFDDEDAEQPKPRGKAILGGGMRGIGLRGGSMTLSSKPRSLAEFSPLKKDRKAV